MDYDIFAGDEHTVRVHLPITSVYLLPIVTLTDYDIFAGDEHTVRVHLPITSVYLLPIVTLTHYDIFAGDEHTAISLHYILYPYTLSFYLPIVTLTCYDIFPGDEHTAIHHFRYFAYHIYLCPPLLLSRLLFHIPCSFYSSLPL